MADLIKHSGQVFTPDYLVKLILDEAGYFGDQILCKHCIDNSCGDGAFLCEIVRRYINEYKRKHKSLCGIQAELKQFIHGIELEDVAFDCCKVNIQTVLKEYNIDDAEIDIRHANTLETHDFDGRMDYVIGNPPYVRVHNLEDSFDTVKTYRFANGGMTDLYLVFFEIGFNMLKLGGKLCYITPSSWINSVAGTSLRSYVLLHRNLVSLVDLGHYQAFKATTYTMISLFQKGYSNTEFTYYQFSPDKLNKTFVCNIPFEDVCVNGNFYLADSLTLRNLREIFRTTTEKYVQVKNGFATLADSIFIKSEFPFTEHVIPVIKASTGKWYKAFYPYDNSGKPLSKDVIFSNTDTTLYLEQHKDALLKGSSEQHNPLWYLYGRTQALKDVWSGKYSINTTIKDIKSIKLNFIPAGSGLYSGLYILTDISFDVISDILLADEFISYISSLKKYKSGGYYTYNSKDLELYLNYKISQLKQNGKISCKTIDKCGVFGGNLKLF